MKVPQSIRNLHADLSPYYERLKKEVDAWLDGRRKPHWHYFSRVKVLESFALKLETGREAKPDDPEDMFAATLVVRNVGEIAEAERLVAGKFPVDHRRPKNAKSTHKHSDSFPFDDLRLYVRWMDGDKARPTGLNRRMFEVQIKTFLQHAWGIATHDLVYKTDTVNWPRERVAFQIRAMLEHAEIAILEVDSLARSPALPRSSTGAVGLGKMLGLLHRFWGPSDLPHDARRLAESVLAVAKGIGLTEEGVRDVLERDAALGRGPKTRNLSPYGIIIEALLRHRTKEMTQLLSDAASRTRVLLTRELELPTELDGLELPSAVRLQ